MTVSVFQFANLRSLFGIDAVPGFQSRISDLGRIYLPELAGLRSVAIIMVVYGHLLQRLERFYDGSVPLTNFERGIFTTFATPFSGCCIFFCISGYLLLVDLSSKSRLINRHDLISYSRQRIIRLWLPYSIILSGTYFFLLTTNYSPAGTNQFFTQPTSLAVSFLASLVFSHDVLFGTFPRLFPPGWFVEMQVQFYIIGPGLWVLYLKIPAGRFRLSIAASFLIVCSAISLLINTNELNRLRYSIFAFMPYFWAGAILADLRLCFKDMCGQVFRRSWQVGWCGLAAFILLGLDNPTLQLTARIFCIAIIFCTAFTVGTSFQRALVNRWMVRIGTASYSIYLVHLQVLQVLTPEVVRVFDHISILPMIVLGSICEIFLVMVASLIFYWLVERPWMAAARLVSRRRLRHRTLA